MTHRLQFPIRAALPSMLCVLVSLAIPLAGQAESLEIHYINVGQGGSTLIVGPDGTTILYDFGNIAGDKRLVPYLTRLPLFQRRRTVEYAMISHADRDHFMGYSGMIASGFQITVSNFEPGTDKQGDLFEKHALEPAKRTTAGAFRPVQVGLMIPLGDDARALVVAANGRVLGEPDPDEGDSPRLNENDRSIALFIQYRNFQFLIDGDLGSGQESCTQHVTNQRAIQPRVARALLSHGLISPEHGVDVMHIAHHGSESSTSAEYFNLMRPEVGLISVGPKQGTFRHPRKAVVEQVLTCPTANGVFSEEACAHNSTRPSCVEAPALRGLFQTDNGTRKGCPSSNPHCVSFVGLAGGNIQLNTDGRSNYMISVDGNLMEPDTGPNVVRNRTWTYALDEI